MLLHWQDSYPVADYPLGSKGLGLGLTSRSELDKFELVLYLKCRL